MQQRPHSSHHPGLGLPSSVTIGSDRYSIAIDDIRYPPNHDRDDGLGAYDQMSARQRYGNLHTASSWQGNPSNISPRSSQQQNYNSSIHHHSQLPQLAINSRMSLEQQQQSDSSSHLGRLPQNSTLLTPLPGYASSASLMNGNAYGAAPDGGYEMYDDDNNNNGRPGTGHNSIGSMGHGSGDDFDHTQWKTNFLSFQSILPSTPV